MTTYHHDDPSNHSAGIAGRVQLATAENHDPRLQRLSDLLKEARPRLIVCVEQRADNTFQNVPCIREDEPPVTEVIDEGFDPINSPLGCPVYWRIVDRTDGRFYYSTFEYTREQVLRVWGEAGLHYCDPDTSMAIARVETYMGELGE
jgi:hypothetical protein